MTDRSPTTPVSHHHRSGCRPAGSPGMDPAEYAQAMGLTDRQVGIATEAARACLDHREHTETGPWGGTSAEELIDEAAPGRGWKYRLRIMQMALVVAAVESG